MILNVNRVVAARSMIAADAIVALVSQGVLGTVFGTAFGLLSRGGFIPGVSARSADARQRNAPAAHITVKPSAMGSGSTPPAGLRPIMAATAMTIMAPDPIIVLMSVDVCGMRVLSPVLGFYWAKSSSRAVGLLSLRFICQRVSCTPAAPSTAAA